MGPGLGMATISSGAVSFPWSSMRRTIHADVGLVRSAPAAVIAVERDEELVMRARLVQRRFEQHAALLDRKTVVLRVTHDVGPSKVPRFERRRHGQQIVELGQRDEMLGPRPSREDDLVIGRNVLAGLFGETDLRRTARS